MTVINRQHRFIYLKSRKSAGTSCEAHLLLNTALGNDIWHTAMDIEQYGLPVQSRRRILRLQGDQLRTASIPPAIYKVLPWSWTVHIGEHHEAKGLQGLLGDFWNSACKVTNVRNPWDMMVSAWQWRRDGRGGTSTPITVEFEEWMNAAFSGDKEWMTRVYAYDPRVLLAPFVFVNGKCVVDVLIRQEAINDGLTELGTRLNLPLGSLAIRTKRSKRKADFRSYYTDALIDKVNTAFADIIRITGYTFDTDSPGA